MPAAAMEMIKYCISREVILAIYWWWWNGKDLILQLPLR